MAIGDFDIHYGQNPWEAVDKNQRDWYYPDVQMIWQRDGVFSRFMTWQYNMRSVGAKKAIITSILPPHPDANPIGLRDIWANARHLDSRAVEVTFEHYGGKLALHKYDDMVTYWRQNGKAGLRAIIQQALGIHMVDSIDLMARNAFLSGALKSGYTMYEGSASDFGTITAADKFDPRVALDIWLGLQNRGVASITGQNGMTGSIVCITTPGVIYDIQKALIDGTLTGEWVDVHNYARPESVLSRYEVGQYKGVRFIASPSATLFNAGTLTFRADVTAPVKAGDGAPDPQAATVDGAYRVGQDGATHHIQLSATPATGVLGTDLKVGDLVTIHVSKTSNYGVTDGVDPFDSRNHVRRVVWVDTVNNRIAFDKPVMLDFDADLGGGVYAYVSKGLNIHSSTFMGAPGGIAGAVGEPPKVYTPEQLGVIDDFQAQYRFTWDAYIGANLFAPENFEVVFSAGTVRVKGAAQ